MQAWKYVPVVPWYVCKYLVLLYNFTDLRGDDFLRFSFMYLLWLLEREENEALEAILELINLNCYIASYM